MYIYVCIYVYVSIYVFYKSKKYENMFFTPLWKIAAKLSAPPPLNFVWNKYY